MTIKETLLKNQEYIVKQYENGTSTCELGRMFGCSNAAVYKFLRDKCKIKMREHNNKRKNRANKIKELNSKGLTTAQIAEEIGDIGVNSVARSLKDMGLESNNRDVRPKGFLKPIANEIIADYESGMGITRLSNKYEAGESVVKRVLRENGVETGQYQKIYNIPHNYFDKIDTPNNAYIIGFFIGDGCNCKNRFQIGITDKQLLYDIRDEMGYDGPISCAEKDIHKNFYKLSFHSKRVTENLCKYSCMPRKSFKTYLPKNIDDNLMSHLFRGLLDSDGCVFKPKENRYKIQFCGSARLMNDIQLYLKGKLNIESKIYPHINIAVCNISRKQDLKIFIPWLYKDADLYLKRKKDRADILLKAIK